ncbi:MAG TPA: DUF997 family protein [Pirellulales bacterium]|nr:DUF997 family protein [Pirellulales bacterium]
MAKIPRREDPLLRSARREALVVLGVWLAAFVYTIGYCYAFGYGRDPDTLSFVLGFPDWVFWGVVTPWSACTAISIWFAMAFMSDDDLGPEPDEAADGGLAQSEAARG